MLLPLNAEACQAVGPGAEGEGAAVFQQHLAGEDEADALPIGFGREEGSEELLLHFSADAPSVIGYLNDGVGRRRGGEDDFRVRYFLPHSL